MAATQNRRMWKAVFKVMLIHFGATIALITGAAATVMWPSVIDIDLIPEWVGWGWLIIFCFLQPQFLIYFQISSFASQHGWIKPSAYENANDNGYEIVLIIPIWSLCFGWIYVRTINWLFPSSRQKSFLIANQQS
jgi:hypothetical protein